MVGWVFSLADGNNIGYFRGGWVFSLVMPRVGQLFSSVPAIYPLVRLGWLVFSLAVGGNVGYRGDWVFSLVMSRVGQLFSLAPVIYPLGSFVSLATTAQVWMGGGYSGLIGWVFSSVWGVLHSLVTSWAGPGFGSGHIRGVHVRVSYAWVRMVGYAWWKWC